MPDGDTAETPAAQVKAVRRTERYGPVPGRAFGDDRLSSADFRILGVVSMHDGLRSNARGCEAGRDRVARLAKVNKSTCSSSLTKLNQLGYIIELPQQNDARKKVRYVVYDEQDDILSNASNASQTRKKVAHRQPASSKKVADSQLNMTEKGCGSATQKNEIGRLDKENRSPAGRKIGRLANQDVVDFKKESQPKIQGKINKKILRETLSGDSDVTKQESDLAKQAFDAFQELAREHDLSIPESLTPQRRKSINAIIETHGAEPIQRAFDEIKNSSFLRGENGKWRVTLDWLFKPVNFQKVIEENYRDRPGSDQSSRSIFDTYRGESYGGESIFDDFGQRGGEPRSITPEKGSGE